MKFEDMDVWKRDHLFFPLWKRGIKGDFKKCFHTIKISNNSLRS